MARRVIKHCGCSEPRVESPTGTRHCPICFEPLDECDREDPWLVYHRSRLPHGPESPMRRARAIALIIAAQLSREAGK